MHVFILKVEKIQKSGDIAAALHNKNVHYLYNFNISNSCTVIITHTNKLLYIH